MELTLEMNGRHRPKNPGKQIHNKINVVNRVRTIQKDVLENNSVGLL